MDTTEDSLLSMVNDRASVESIIKIINAHYKIYLHPDDSRRARTEDLETLNVIYKVMERAVKTHYVALVKHMFKCGYSKIEQSGLDVLFRTNTPIVQLICEKGNIDMIKAILLYKPNLCSFSLTPFGAAMEHDNVDILKLLLPLYHRQRKEYNNDYPLIVAIQKGAIKCFKYIIEHYPREINARTQFGYTPLLLSVKKGLKFVQPLLEKGAGVAPRLATQRSSCLHALFSNDFYSGDPYYFMSTEAPHIARILIQKGADVNAMDLDLATPLTLVCKQYSKELSFTKEKMEYSLETHHKLITESVKVLLNAGSNPRLGTIKVAAQVLIETITASWHKLMKVLSQEQGGARHFDLRNKQKKEIQLTGENAYKTLILILQCGGTPDCGRKSALDLVTKFLNAQYNVKDSLWELVWPDVMKLTKTLLLYGAGRVSIKDLVVKKYYSKSLLCMIYRCLSFNQRLSLRKSIEKKCKERLHINELVYFQDLLSQFNQPRELSDTCRMVILGQVQIPYYQIQQIGLPAVLTEYVLAIDMD